MKIKFLYRTGQAWPWSMGRGFENALTECGHDVDAFISQKDASQQVKQYDQLYEFLKKPCDMFIAMGGGDKYKAFHYNEKIWEYVRNMRVPRLAYFMESMKTRKLTQIRYRASVPLWSHILTCDETELDEIRKLGCPNVEYAPGWVDERMFYPMQLPEKYEFQFIGYIHQHRLPYAEHFIKNLGMGIGRYDTVEAYARAINETRIVMGIPSVFRGFTQRVAETLACGKVLLYQTLPEGWNRSQSLFKDREHIVFYKNMEEAVELAKFYSADKEARKRIEENARKVILDKHTIMQRAKEFIYYAHA